MDFIEAPYDKLADVAAIAADGAGLIVRNATWFPPIKSRVPTISLLQDIIPDGEMRKMQEAVIASSRAAVFNSAWTASKYLTVDFPSHHSTIPLPVDFSLFTPQNAMGCQQALSLPGGCVCWIGASQGAAGYVKGYDIFLSIVRQNPDIPFVGVFKDAVPESVPPNLRVYARLTHADLVKVIGACRVGLCTSRTESQHLAGIEMGACGLPLVVPPVGIYWKRADWPGCEVKEQTVAAYTQAIRSITGKLSMMQQQVSDYWRAGFDKPVIRTAWTKLIEEVECSGRS
jgi:hypothetical protein